MKWVKKRRIRKSFFTSIISMILLIVSLFVVIWMNKEWVYGTGSSSEKKQEEAIEQDDELAGIIRSSFDKKIVYDLDVYSTLTKASLEIAYDRNLILEGRNDDYAIIVRGEDIEDYNTELDLKLEVKKTKDGYKIKRASDDKLPGKVSVKIRNTKLNKKYLYIYNKVQGKYILLDGIDEDNVADYKNINVINGYLTWELDRDSTYLLTDKDINKVPIRYELLIYVGIAIIILSIIYVLVKKKYWFW